MAWRGGCGLGLVMVTFELNPRFVSPFLCHSPNPPAEVENEAQFDE